MQSRLFLSNMITLYIWNRNRKHTQNKGPHLRNIFSVAQYLQNWKSLYRSETTDLQVGIGSLCNEHRVLEVFYDWNIICNLKAFSAMSQTKVYEIRHCYELNNQTWINHSNSEWMSDASKGNFIPLNKLKSFCQQPRFNNLPSTFRYIHPNQRDFILTAVLLVWCMNKNIEQKP